MNVLPCLTMVAAFGLALQASADEDSFLRPVGRPPQAAAQRRQGGQALPPLPLPVTPLRRSEKKRPPSPATLVGKVIWGSHLDYRWEDDTVTRVYDWNMVPADGQQLLRLAKEQLGQEYKVETTDLDSFNATPAEIPVLFFSGGRSLKFTPAQRETLRTYMLAGGMTWFDSCVGSPYFYASALAELEQIFPESRLVRVPADHPIFHVVEDTVEAKVHGKGTLAPILDGVYVGSRLAAVVSPYGLGASWDATDTSLIPEASYYDRQSAMLLGLNLVAYSIGYFRVGQAHARADLFRSEDLLHDSDALVFTQIRTNGVWNTEPGAADNLLRFLDRNFNIRASYRKRAVRLGEDSLDNTPFLYLSGITRFSFSDGERQALREFIRQGGFLLVDNSLGLQEFDAAARAELATLFGAEALTRVPLDHPVFSAGPYTLRTAGYTVAVKASQPELNTPWLEGVWLDGDYRVFYSPFDLAAGWQGDDHPLARGYAPGDALALGANLVSYFLTH